MTLARPPLVMSIAVQAAFGLVLYLLIAPERPDGVVADTAAGSALGAATGLALLVALARGSLPRPRIPRSRLPAISAKACVLAFGALSEELLWRVVALGALAAELGGGLALALTSIGFALSHAHHGRRAVGTQLVTGSAFGAVFLATASYAGASIAHVTYNLGALVAWESAPEREDDWSPVG